MRVAAKSAVPPERVCLAQTLFGPVMYNTSQNCNQPSSLDNQIVAPAPIFCNEKKTLMERFTKAVSNYLRMQTAQMRALRNGEGLRFEAEIKSARKVREQAKRAIVEHERQHGC